MENLTIFNTDIIPVYITDEGKKLVIGRELHERLNIGSRYNDWIPDMIALGFRENVDFSSFTEKRVKPQGGRPAENHTLSLDMAKHIAMIQRTPEGFAIRQKLIELENSITELSPQLQVLINLEHKQKQQEQEIKQTNGKIEAVNADLQEFKQDIPLLGVEEIKVSNAVKKKGVDCLGGKQSAAYGDNSIRGKVYADIHRQLKREFGVTTYKAIKRRECDLALGIIEAYELPHVLQEQIKAANQQVSI